jgi:hypothetical protein
MCPKLLLTTKEREWRDLVSSSGAVFLNFYGAQKSIPSPPAYVAWGAGTGTLFQAPIDCLKIPAQLIQKLQLIQDFTWRGKNRTPTWYSTLTSIPVKMVRTTQGTS